MRRLLATLILLVGCAVPATPWDQTWADPTAAVYRAVVVRAQLELAEVYRQRYGPTRELREVVYFTRRWIPWSPQIGGWCSWDPTEEEATIFLAVHRADWERNWIHELHHARIGDGHHRDPSWADLRTW